MLLHQLVRPVRLAHRLARQKLLHDRLDVEHWRIVDGVQLGDVQDVVLASENAHDGTADAIGAVLAALRKDADLGPGRVVPRMAGAVDDLVWVDAIEAEDDLRVREFLDPRQRVGFDGIGQDDLRVEPAPLVVFSCRARAAYATDRFHLDHLSLLSPCPPTARLTLRSALCLPCCATCRP